MPDPVRRTVALSTPPSDVDSVHDFLAQVWIDAGTVDDDDRLSFETALIELMANVITHADADGAGLACVLTVVVDDEHLWAELSDSGVAGDLTIVGTSMPATDAESGRGLALIEALVDEVDYRRVDDRNRWTLLRRRSR